MLFKLSPPRAYLYAAIAVLGWSTVASAFKITLRSLSVVEMLFYSSAASALLLVSIRRTSRDTTPLPPLKSCLKIGALVPCSYYAILFQAYDLLPAQYAQALNYSWPLAMSLLAILFLKEPIQRKRMAALLLGFGGILIICLSKGPIPELGTNDIVGMALAIGSAVFWAAYWIWMLKSPYSPLSFLTGGFLGSLPYLLCAWLITNPLSFPSIPGILGCLYIGVFEMGLTFYLWSSALKMSSQVTSIANLAYLSPFLSLMWIYWVLGEPLEELAILGLVVLVCAILLGTAKYADQE